MKRKHKNIALIILILLIGLLLRTVNPNWDNNHHLHPDERFLTMVADKMTVPITIGTYLDQKRSTFNPRNLEYDFYVYGSFPLIANKLLSVSLNNDNYNAFTIQGRLLSGFLDLIVVFLVYKMGGLLEKKKQIPKHASYWAAFIYAISVLPIQLSHFFTVDTFANLFLFSSVFFSLRFFYAKKDERPLTSFFLAAIFLGLALASKISALLALPLLAYFLAIRSYQQKTSLIPKCISKPTAIHKIISLALHGIVFLFTAYIVLRFADPNLFASPSFLNPKINPSFLANFAQLKSWEGSDVWFPPGVQWINTQPVLFSAKNITFFGMGIAATLLLITGVLLLIKQSLKKPWKKSILNNHVILVLIVWTFFFFMYQSTQFVKSLRYFFYLYPYFALFAGAGTAFIVLAFQKHFAKKKTKNRNIHILIALLILSLVVWPLMFISIYLKPHSRVTASEWIHANLENNSVIVNELWDDPLPLHLGAQSQKNFSGDMLGVFDEDTPEKWDTLSQEFAKADYYVLSSNRGWGSMPTVPEKYPYMTKFYSDLLTNQSPQFVKVAEFTSYPSLEYLGIPLTVSDDWAEEAFTVYDHPKVLIYKIQK